MRRSKPLLGIVLPVYDSAASAQRAISALTAQQIDTPVCITVVDDGSPTPLTIHPVDNPRIPVTLLRLDVNSGRAAARNAGIAATHTHYITLLDADCVPDPFFLANILRHLQSHPRILFGHIVFASGDQFFDDYENVVQQQRLANMTEWDIYLTSANVTISVEVLAGVQGFDQRYRRYGFEDRDLFARIRKTFPDTTPIYCTECSVSHEETATIKGLRKKFFVSGRFSAPIFRENQPEAYRRMSTYHFDAEAFWLYKPIPNTLLRIIAVITESAATWTFCIARYLQWNRLAASALRACKATAYLRGTAASRHQP